MAKRSPNPKTSYGRKRIRNEYEHRVANMAPAEREAHESSVSETTIFVWVIVIIICLIAYMSGGSSGLMSTLNFLNNQ